MFVCCQDGLLSAGYGELINRMHAQIPKVTNDGKRLQMVVCSATLHSFDVKKMAVSSQCNIVFCKAKSCDLIGQ